MKLSTLALLSIRNKKVDPSLGVSDVIDITKILFVLSIKLFSDLTQKYWKAWMHNYRNEVLRTPLGTLTAKDEYSHPNRG